MTAATGQSAAVSPELAGTDPERGDLQETGTSTPDPSSKSGYNTRMSTVSPDDPRLRQYQALLDVSEAITRHGDLAELFHDLAGRLRQVVPFAYITVLLHDPAANMMRRHLL